MINQQCDMCMSTRARLIKVAEFIDKVIDSLPAPASHNFTTAPGVDFIEKPSVEAVQYHTVTNDDGEAEQRRRMMLDSAPAQSTPRGTAPTQPKPSKYPPPSDYCVLLGKCMVHLASVCDYANTDDGVGFNGRDTEMGHSLAEWWKKNNFFTNKQKTIAEAMVRRYRKQLEKAGYDLGHLS